MAKHQTQEATGLEELRREPMMDHLLTSLERGKDIGHYGRLVFVMVARHFLSEDKVVKYLTLDKDCDEAKARLLFRQVNAHDYNPPKRERIIEWMEQQGFPICPDAGDPDACNVYKNLNFPEKIYDHISQYQTAKMESEGNHA
jgi:DNA primase large subunit